MLRQILFIAIGFTLTTALSAQGKIIPNSPIHYRLLMTSVNIEDVQPDEISISLNAFNTGRQPIDLSNFNSAPEEMEIKFEESFHRSNLSELQDEILSSLFAKNIVIPNGKILRDLRFNLPSNQALYKQLTKKNKRYTKNYNPKKRINNGPEVKYKTSNKKLNPTPSLFAKRNKKKSSSKKDEVNEVVASANTKKDTKLSSSSKTSPIGTNPVKTRPKNLPSKNEVDMSKEKIVKVDSSYNTSSRAINKSAAEKSKVIATTKVNSKTNIESKSSTVNTPSTAANSTSIAKPKTNSSTEMASKKIVPTVEVKKKKEILSGESIAEVKKIDVVEPSTIGIEEKVEEKTPKKLSIIERQKLKRQERELAKKNEYKFEKASQKEDEKAILESLGANKKDNEGVAFDTKASVEASKNSYAEKALCPDLVLQSINVVKNKGRSVTLEYTLANVGKGPAYLGKNKRSQGIALRAFLSSSERISRGALPLSGGFVDYDDDGSGHKLYPNNSFTGTLKLDINTMTRFTPFIILNFDPFNVIDECDKTNNYGSVKVGK